MSRPAISWRRGLVSLLMALAIMGLAACGGEDEVATERESIPEVTPGANDEIPAGVEAATITISDGTFNIDDLTLMQGEPTELTVVNQDADAYAFEIESLTEAMPIAAEGTSEIGFTTPNDGTYTGMLKTEDGTTVDEITVNVLGPEGG